MPNWAYGDVTVTGDADNIAEFLKHFLYNDVKPQGRYFARSFSTESYSETVDRLANEMENTEDEENMSFSILVEFAWSAYSCLIDGYPQNFRDTCITLDQACYEHNVSVEILTSEDGMAFAEHYVCTPDGITLNEAKDYDRYVCTKCGEEQSISPFSEIDGEECYECGAHGPGTWKVVAHE